MISLEQLAPEYGAERRRLRVLKYRGARRSAAATTTSSSARGGLEVFPRLVAAEHHRAVRARPGAERHPRARPAARRRPRARHQHAARWARPARGKSTLAAQYAAAAAERGERAALFIFDESVAPLLSARAGLGIDARASTSTPGASASSRSTRPSSRRASSRTIRRRGRERGSARVVVIDSLNGYLNAMPEERFLTIQLHELLTYLGQQGVATLLVGAQHGLIGSRCTPGRRELPRRRVILLRYFEARARCGRRSRS